MRQTRQGIGRVGLVVTIAISVTVAALALPALRRVHEANVRSESTDNLKAIMLAMHAYHDVHKFLPYCSTTPVTANTPTGGSAHFQLLPHVGENAAYEAGHADRAISVYMCPMRGRPATVCWTDYCYNLYLNSNTGELLGTNSKRNLVSISDGSSNTIGLGYGTISKSNWGATSAFDGSGSIFTTPSVAGYETFRGGDFKDKPAQDGSAPETIKSWGGPFSDGTLMGMCDATVRLFPFTNLPRPFHDYLTASGDEFMGGLPDS